MSEPLVKSAFTGLVPDPISQGIGYVLGRKKGRRLRAEGVDHPDWGIRGGLGLALVPGSAAYQLASRYHATDPARHPVVGVNVHPPVYVHPAAHQQSSGRPVLVAHHDSPKHASLVAEAVDFQKEAVSAKTKAIAAAGLLGLTGLGAGYHHLTKPQEKDLFTVGDTTISMTQPSIAEQTKKKIVKQWEEGKRRLSGAKDVLTGEKEAK